MIPFMRCELVKCGKANCGTCYAAGGHGPYWYEYSRDIRNKLHKKYIGKNPANRLGIQDYGLQLLGGFPIPHWALCEILGVGEKDTFSEMRRIYRAAVAAVSAKSENPKPEMERMYKEAWKQLRGERR